MQVKVHWKGDTQFEGKSGSGHSVLMDGPETAGGCDAGPRPMEMLLLGMGGCASFDVISILKKSRQQINDCVASISAERADAVPAVFTNIQIEFNVTGTNLKESQVKRAVELSAEKYCSASIMLQKAGVNITHSYKISESDYP